ncbi:MAG TPA: family 16 glycoside hydrolase, partial [Schlesneria sp.]
MTCQRLLALSLVALLGCGAQAPGPTAEKGPISEPISKNVGSDAEIAEQIGKVLIEHNLGSSDITISFKKGVAVLSGDVQSDVERKTALKATASVPGVQSVLNQLQIAVAKTAEVKSQAVQTASKDSATPALEEPTADGHNWLKREELEQGWVRLFDGQTLFGWIANSDLNWAVKDGVISADTGKPGLLCTTTRFADYELRCDYKVAADGNSGIFLRTPFDPKDPAVDCYELNMCDTHPAFGTASLVKRAKPEPAVMGDGEWHSFHVRIDGPKIVVTFDGKQVLEYTDATEKPLTTGHIGLQMNGGKIEFRNVYLKPLGTQPLFDGESLKGWREVAGSKSQFSVKDGTIHVKDGRGFLETERTAENFVLQFEAITNGDKLNSGIFFRAMPGTEKAPSNGYEFQIQSGFKNGDRTQPDDHGTGAIFKRV